MLNAVSGFLQCCEGTRRSAAAFFPITMGIELRHGAACELEGLSQAVAGVLFGCAVSRDDHPERVRFNIINRETGNRVRYEVVDAETGEEVPQEDRVKGYKVDGDNYVLLEEEELDDVALESTHTIEIESFVDREGGGRDLSRRILIISCPTTRSATRRSRSSARRCGRRAWSGIARVVLYRRERLLMLQPRGKGIVGTTLRYKNEVRDERPISTTSRTSKCRRTCSISRSTS